ncbi:MAG: hypothetical protein HY876_07325 [Coriobacteriales bacterium]|nr:hypothetical protein [Coriobacteriales bacterium]
MKRWHRTAFLVAMFVILMTAPAFAVRTTPVISGSHAIDAFPSPERCACHSELFAQWERSMHAKALSDPVYQAKLAQAEKATGGKLGAFCNRCHGPVAFMAGEFERGSKLSDTGAMGVQCAFCHQSTGSRGRIGNVSQVVTPGAFRAQIRDPQAPHAAEQSSFVPSAELCGACHDVLHPANGVKLESPYREWKAGPYAKRGIVCQHCHMGTGGPRSAPFSGQACGVGPRRENLFAMTFAGANVGQGDAALATKQLQAAARVSIRIERPKGAAKEATAAVTVRNVGAGHYIPTGLTEVRQMWLEVALVDGTGVRKTVRTHRYGTSLGDSNGNAPVELWEATRIASDDRIPPMGASTDRVPISSEGLTPPVRLVAALKYRSLPDDLARKARVKNPTTVMASAESMFVRAPSNRESSRGLTLPGPLRIALLAVIAGAFLFGVVMVVRRLARSLG